MLFYPKYEEQLGVLEDGFVVPTRSRPISCLM